MSTGTRRLNYTSRKRLQREHIQVGVLTSDPPAVSASIDLASYRLPADARVFLEAHRQTAWQRFDFGTVAQMRAPDDLTLRDFGAAEGVQFRVKVVDASSADTAAARILAQADGITPKEDGPRRSLLPLDPDPNLLDEVWRLDLDENDGPVVKVSMNLVADRHKLARSPEFVSLVLPEILRRSLTWALKEGLPEEDDWNTPRGKWIRFGCGLLGQAEPPDELNNDDDESDDRERWVEEVASRFCRLNRVDQVFGSWWSGKSGAA